MKCYHRVPIWFPQGIHADPDPNPQTLVKRGKRKGWLIIILGYFSPTDKPLYDTISWVLILYLSHRTQVQVCNVHLKNPPCFKLLSLIFWLAKQVLYSVFFCLGLTAWTC
jgi:hypothetical protein